MSRTTDFQNISIFYVLQHFCDCVRLTKPTLSRARHSCTSWHIALLPVTHRIEYKIALMTYSCVHGIRVQPTSTASVVQLHLSRAVRCWGQPTTENSLSPEQDESATVHAASVLALHLSGTIYRDTSEMMTLVVSNSLAIWKHFCLHGPIRQRRLWERLFKRCFIKGLTYLLQYCSPLLPNTLVVQVEQSVWGVCVSVTRNLTFEPNNLYTNIFGKQVQLDSI